MSRKYPKKDRKQHKARLAAAAAFVEAWTTSELSYNLIPVHHCPLNCAEAETYAGLFRAYDYPNTADQILEDHGETCDGPHASQVWQVDIEACGVEPDASWTIVADGKRRSEAETRAKEWLRRHLRGKFAGRRFELTVMDTSLGVPSPTALYSWVDLRKAA